MRRLVILPLCWMLLCGAASRSFDGTNDSVDYGDIPTLSDSTGSISGGGWVLTDNVTSDQTVWSNKRTAGAARGVIFFQDDAGGGRTDTFHIFVEEADEVTSTSCIGVNSAAVVDTWQWVAFSLTANNSSGMRLYIDGLEDANSPCTSSGVDNMGQSNEGWHIGADPLNEDDRSGEQAYMQLWSRLLTLQELEEARWQPGIIAASLEVFAPTWGASTEQDLSGQGNTGTVSNATTSADGPPVFLGGGLPL